MQCIPRSFHPRITVEPRAERAAAAPARAPAPAAAGQSQEDLLPAAGSVWLVAFPTESKRNPGNRIVRANAVNGSLCFIEILLFKIP